MARPMKLQPLAWVGVSEKITNALRAYEEFQFARAIEEIWRLIAEIDQVITKLKPWKLYERPFGPSYPENLSSRGQQ